MAANLKLSTFSLMKWLGVIMSSLLVVMYFKSKIDFFSVQCQSSEDENGWRSFLASIWLWVSSSSSWLWQRDQPMSDNDLPAAADNELLDRVPKCDSSSWEIFLHVVMISIVNDVKLVCTKFTDLVAIPVGDAMLVCVDTFRSGVAAIFDRIQSALYSLLMKTTDEYSQNLIDHHHMFLTGNFIPVILLTCFLAFLFVLFLYWMRQYFIRQKKKRPVYNETSSMTYSHNDYEYDDSYSTDSVNMENNSIRFLRSNDRQRQVEGITDRRGMLHRFDGHTRKHGFADTAEIHSHVTRRMSGLWSPVSMTACLIGILLCVSIPWEFCRLYQQAVALKASAAFAGLPPECDAKSLSLLQTLTFWLSWQLSWSHGNPCERYYEAVFVDPLWETTPLMVLVSLVTRCIVHPAEMLAMGLGRALRHFFTEIPLHWQPVCLVVMMTLALLLLITACSYRFSVPMLFRIEPKSPPNLTQARRTKFDTLPGKGDDRLSVNHSPLQPYSQFTNCHSVYTFLPNKCQPSSSNRTDWMDGQMQTNGVEIAARKSKERNSKILPSAGMENAVSSSTLKNDSGTKMTKSKTSRGKSRTRH